MGAKERACAEARGGNHMVCLRNGRKVLEVGAQRVVDEEREGNTG